MYALRIPTPEHPRFAQLVEGIVLSVRSIASRSQVSKCPILKHLPIVLGDNLTNGFLLCTSHASASEEQTVKSSGAFFEMKKLLMIMASFCDGSIEEKYSGICA